MKNIVIIGTGGLAREFLAQFSTLSEKINVIGFSSTNALEHADFSLPGVLFGDNILPETIGTREAVIAVGNPAVRKSISNRLKSLGFIFPSFIHPSSIVSDRVFVGEGVVVSANCVVSPNVKLGDFSYLNFCCGVGHDATIGAYVQINPGSQLGGFCSVGEETLVGSGSTILHGVVVGAHATVGSGSVVFSTVKDGATVMGNPAKRMLAFERQ